MADVWITPRHPLLARSSTLPHQRQAAALAGKATNDLHPAAGLAEVRSDRGLFRPDLAAGVLGEAGVDEHVASGGLEQVGGVAVSLPAGVETSSKMRQKLFSDGAEDVSALPHF